MSWDNNTATTIVPAFDVPPHILEMLKAANLPLNKDGLLMLQQQHKKQLDYYKESEMELRKLVVKFLVAKPKEGTNTVELGGGYVAKAGIAFNYKLDADNEKIEKCLANMSKISNEAAFIADRLVTWTPNFQLTEYRELVANAETSEQAKFILMALEEILIITDKAPTLTITAPKVKK